MAHELPCVNLMTLAAPQNIRLETVREIQPANHHDYCDVVCIPAATFRMGSGRHHAEEAPERRVMMATDFHIDRYPVTNARFARFVAETGYITVAERPTDLTRTDPHKPPDFPSSLVFHKTAGRPRAMNPRDWWNYLPGADWRHPRGPASSIERLGDHPVVHVAYADAFNYAAWAGKQLPTEAEWEFAARGGLIGSEYVWGNTLKPDGRVMANIWHGEFPWHNTREDGYEWTSPVGTFAPNGYGLYDMAGNVWEWTRDWDDGCGRIHQACCLIDSTASTAWRPKKIVKGGSFLCAAGYCRRFRPAARMALMVETTTCDLGFRCVTRLRS